MLAPRAWQILACPSCGGSITRSDNIAECEACRLRYPINPTGQIDLRLQRAKSYNLPIDVSPSPLTKEGFHFDLLRPNPSPQIDLSGIRFSKELEFGNRLNRELISYFPRASPAEGGFMLDLGCGSRDFVEICRRTNLEYIGMDYSGEQPDLLGDAHALPFKDAAFDFVMSMAVLEHLRNPFVAMREVYRVLKPGGLFIGTVAFLEPFHENSYYHHTHLGTYNVLTTAGFDVKQVAPNLEWTGLKALANMSLFPGLPRGITNMLVLPIRVLTRLWWKVQDMRYKTRGSWDTWRKLSVTGGYRFIAYKPAASDRAGG